VGLYHIDKITPEAVELGESLLEEGYKEYVIDDAELERVYKSYPNIWRKPDKPGNLAFIGCPHLSRIQLEEWADRIIDSLKAAGRTKVKVDTVLCTAPPVKEAFVKTEKYAQLVKTGATVTTICPLMYTSNPLTKSKRIMTCSNKLRTYSMARYFKDDELLAIITGKEE